MIYLKGHHWVLNALNSRGVKTSSFLHELEACILEITVLCNSVSWGILKGLRIASRSRPSIQPKNVYIGSIDNALGS